MSAFFFFSNAVIDLGFGRGDHVHFEKKHSFCTLLDLKNPRDARGLARAWAALLSNRKGQSDLIAGHL